MDKTPDKYHILLIYVVLALAIIVVFEPVRHNEFVDYDDNEYVTENPNVTGGLTRESVIWAFTKPHFYMWHPLTTLSHILDYELFGLNPFWHHMVSLLIHLTNALLLFWLLKRMTGAVYPSAFVAAVFALHPLTVESVAWAAERKNVLSAFFWMLTIAAYIQYTERRGVGRYLLVVLSLCLGLMAKPTVVTLPFALLLLDYWPLGRFQWGRESREKILPQLESVKINYQSSPAWRLVGEKIPLFILAAVVSTITFIVQQSTVASIEKLPLNFRISNALVSYISYIGKMIYPARLAVLYPHRSGGLPVWQPIVSFVILAGVTVVLIYMAKRRRYLAVGWLWYLGTLVPVIGLVQVGSQAMADRYTYLPSIGFLIIVTWGAAELFAKWRYRKSGLVIAAGLVLAILSICTRTQIRYWQSSFTLFGHTLEVTENNRIMHNNYGTTLMKQGRFDEAAAHFSKAIQISPDYTDAHSNLGAAFYSQGKLDQAITHFTKALQIRPDFAPAHSNLGAALVQHGKLDEAITHFREALRIKPDDAEAHSNLGAVLTRQGKLDQAVTHFKQAVKLDPDLADAHRNLGDIFLKQSDFNKAASHFRETLRLKPDWIGPMNNLAWILATHKEAGFHNPKEAIRLAEWACELTKYENPSLLDTLAVAYAAAGRFSDAVSTAEKALELTQSSQQKDLTEQIQNHLHSYKAGKPYIEPSSKTSSD